MNDTMQTAPHRVHSVILRLGDRFCSLPVDCVREMTVLPEIKQLCGTSPYVPGVITLRGEAIPVVDLRMRLGMSDIMDENRNLMMTLQDREQEHQEWVSELEMCVHEGRRFSLSLDPTLCKFGKWLTEYQPQTRELSYLLQGFQGPHADLHALGQKVLQLAGSGQTDEALRAIELARTSELDAFSKHFKRVYAYLSEEPRLIVTVIRVGEEQVGLIVDEVASLAWVRAEEGDISREASMIDGLFSSMGRNESDSRMVSMLNPDSLRVHAA